MLRRRKHTQRQIKKEMMKRKTHANELQNNFDRVSIVMSKKEAVAMIASMTQRKKKALGKQQEHL